MSKSKTPAKHTADAKPGDFQLETPDIHNMLGQPFVNKIIDFLNHEDLNDDGRPDIAQIAPLAKAAYPILMELGPLLHTPTFLHWLADLPFWTDKAAVVDKITQLAPLAVAAANLHSTDEEKAVQAKEVVSQLKTVTPSESNSTTETKETY